ncbi:MAG: hypothetical protein WC194_07350, partial [Mesotoga sp.]|uniref:hypothetical protein n=1 Tax=Mesotoga sp. TaxID=2053577 RepID=UPI003569183A
PFWIMRVNGPNQPSLPQPRYWEKVPPSRSYAISMARNSSTTVTARKRSSIFWRSRSVAKMTGAT